MLMNVQVSAPFKDQKQIPKYGPNRDNYIKSLVEDSDMLVYSQMAGS